MQDWRLKAWPKLQQPQLPLSKQQNKLCGDGNQPASVSHKDRDGV